MYVGFSFLSSPSNTPIPTSECLIEKCKPSIVMLTAEVAAHSSPHVIIRSDGQEKKNHSVCSFPFRPRQKRRKLRNKIRSLLEQVPFPRFFPSLLCSVRKTLHWTDMKPRKTQKKVFFHASSKSPETSYIRGNGYRRGEANRGGHNVSCR